MTAGQRRARFPARYSALGLFGSLLQAGAEYGLAIGGFRPAAR